MAKLASKIFRLAEGMQAAICQRKRQWFLMRNWNVSSTYFGGFGNTVTWTSGVIRKWQVPAVFPTAAIAGMLESNSSWGWIPTQTIGPAVLDMTFEKHHSCGHPKEGGFQYLAAAVATIG